MAKPKTAASPFDALVQARQKPHNQLDVQTGKQLDSQSSQSSTMNSKLAKSVDPNFLKFTTYIRKQTHRAVKLKLVEHERELSDLVEELLAEWLQRQSRL